MAVLAAGAAVVIVEENAPVCEALGRWVDVQPGLWCCAGIHSILMLAQVIADHKPRVAVMDLHCGKHCVLGTVRDLAGIDGSPRVVILTSSVDARDIEKALDAGVYGYVSRLEPLRELGKALQFAALGKVHLSKSTVHVLGADARRRAGRKV